MHRVIPHLALLIALMGGIWPEPALAQRPKKEPAVRPVPPQPVQLNVKVRREGKTEIPLSIHGVANVPLRYLIRTPPQAGKASEPKPTGKETATTVYEPPADLGITTDRFFYAVQSTAGVSAPVEVAITILDQPPQLKIPNNIDFEKVRAGDTATKYLEISNTGGSLAIGEVVVEAPWRIDGKTAYRLGAGDMTVFKLIFAPSTGGKFENVARFTSDPAHSTVLRGMGETSVTASPAEVVLQNAGNDPARNGTLTLINQTDEPRELEIKGGERLKVDPKVTLPPKGRVDVPVQIPGTDVRALQAEIQVVAPDFELRVPVTAAAPGAIMRVTPSAIAFGKIPIKPLPSLRFEVENIGGAPGEISWTVPEPFRTSQDSALLIPGEKRAYNVEIEAKNVGVFRGMMQCKAGARTFEIPVEAEITAVAYAGAGRPRPVMSNVGIEEVAPVPEPEPQEVKRVFSMNAQRDWTGDRKLPAGVKATALNSRSARIEWPAVLSPADRFRIELRQFIQTDSGLGVSWLELRDVEIKKEGDHYFAVIKDLDPGQPWVARVLPIKNDGTPEAKLFAINFKTPAKMSFIPRVTWTSGMWVLAAAFVVFRAVIWWLGRRRLGS